MATGRTADARLYVADASELVQLTNVLGVSIGGSSVTSRQGFLGAAYEEASIHSVSKEVAFSTLYSTAAFDTSLDSLIATGRVSPEDEFTFLVVDDGEAGSELWRAIPVSFGRPGWVAPVEDAITRPWTMGQRGRESWGVNVYPFTTTTSAVTLATGVAADSRIGILLLTNGAGVTETTVSIHGTDHDLGTLPGYREVDSGNAVATITVASTGAGDSTGFVLVGQQEVLPSG